MASHGIHTTGLKKADDPIQYEKDVYSHGLKFERPPFTFRSEEWEPRAEARMSAESAGYVVGSAGTGETSKKNRAAFSRWSIVPRRLVKTETLPDLSAKALGHDLQFPIAVAPVGVQRELCRNPWLARCQLADPLLGIFNPEGEEAAARAASKENVPYILSTASSTGIEDVAKANGDGIRWFQLYWPARQHDDITISMLKRAQDNGFTALFVTLDTYILGWRPSDMDNGFVFSNLQLGHLLTFVSGITLFCGLTRSVLRLVCLIPCSAGSSRKDTVKRLSRTWAQLLQNGLPQCFQRLLTAGKISSSCASTGRAR